MLAIGQPKSRSANCSFCFFGFGVDRAAVPHRKKPCSAWGSFAAFLEAKGFEPLVLSLDSRNEAGPEVAGDQQFKSTSLQRGVSNEPCGCRGVARGSDPEFEIRFASCGKAAKIP